MSTEDTLRQQAFVILSPLRSGTEDVVRLSDALEAVAAEREACAKECDELHHNWRWDDDDDSPSGPRDCAVAIRARKEPQG